MDRYNEQLFYLCQGEYLSATLEVIGIQINLTQENIQIFQVKLSISKTGYILLTSYLLVNCRLCL
jgi:hypothetical protein